ncbi:hypothetical protein [Sabulibacter ruber]|uniref:hypothetical protein n=1 Tax=Sabulibacter ruber TaxID=2811901 RepID=UPI001A95ED1D|nr:hypothetical protein [Sabulibacter ruber]
MKGKEKGKTFKNQPHTISRKIGNTPVGFDICDECNTYFGTIGRTDLFTVSPEVALIETYGVLQFLSNAVLDSSLKLKSRFFQYHLSTSAVQPKGDYELKPKFLKNFTRQFKRGIYEVFLQEYHRCTQNGLDQRFDHIRSFARADLGDLPLYFLEEKDAPQMEAADTTSSLSFPENALLLLDEFGFYSLRLMGRVFFLEVTPKAKGGKETYFRKEHHAWHKKGSLLSKLVKLELITDLDFTLRSTATDQGF